MYDDNSPQMNGMEEVPHADYKHASIEELGTAFISITDQIEKLMTEREQLRKAFNNKANNAYAQVNERDAKFMSRTGIGYSEDAVAVKESPRYGI